MRTRFLPISAALLLFAGAAIAAPTVEARLAKQNALFRRVVADQSEAQPDAGDRGRRLPLQRPARRRLARRGQAAARHQRGLSARIKAISPDGFSEEDRTSHDLFLRNLQEQRATTTT